MIRPAYWVIGATVIGLACLLGAVSQQDSASSVQTRLIGTWELVSTVEYLTDGSERPYPDVGPRGKGFLMYTTDGHMCAAGMNPDRLAWKDVNKPTDAEKLSAMEGFFGYCGRYEMDTANHVIYHYPEVALDPGWVGTKQKRPYRFEGEILTFSDQDTTPGVKGYTISWKKIRSTG